MNKENVFVPAGMIVVRNDKGERAAVHPHTGEVMVEAKSDPFAAFTAHESVIPASYRHRQYPKGSFRNSK